MSIFRTAFSIFATSCMALAQQPPILTSSSTTTQQPPLVVSSITPVAPLQSTRAIDLVLCLDTSGSMENLIQQAQQHLWTIVNETATLRPQPELRVALLAFGSPSFGADRGYVSIQTGLTSDLDLVSQKLFGLATDGGDEYVAGVIRTALDQLDWAKDPSALKMMFVAGNEGAAQDPRFDVLQVAGDAISRGVVVNTIYCDTGASADEADGWRQVARRADGSFAPIDPSQLAVIESPFDGELAKLSAQLNGTYLYYGAQRGSWARNQVQQDVNVGRLNPAAAAERCQMKASSNYNNPNFDLVDACRDPAFVLANVKAEDLPEELRGLSPEELGRRVAEMTAKRAALQASIAEFGKKRSEFVAAARKERMAQGEVLFEDVMLEALRARAKALGFALRSESKPLTGVCGDCVIDPVPPLR